MSFSNLKLKWKFVVGFSGVLGVVVAMCVMVLINISDIHTALEARSRLGESRNTARAVLADLVEQQNAVRGFVANGDESFIGKMDSEQKAFTADVHHLDELAADDTDLKQKVAELVSDAAEVRQQEDGQIAQRRLPDKVAQAQASILTTGRLTKVREAMKWISDHEDSLVSVATATQSRSVTLASATLWIGGLISAILATVIGLLLIRLIAAPVIAMTQTMRKLAAGDLAVEVPASKQQDEVGDMARAVLVFKDNALEKARLERDSIEQATAAEAARREAEAELLAKERKSVVETVGRSMSALARGDLTYRMADVLSGEYSQLRADFNAAVESLQSTMRAISGSTGGVGSGSNEIASASDDLSRRTEQQAASLEETAAALDEITATVKRSADGAKKANDAAARTKDDVTKSSQVMSEAVSAMGEIEESARQIAQIIGVIDEIAFQTNLLALNAGVEAARAGDSGRGFAVVAQEVRALAQRSADAAKEIKALIASSSDQVRRGVRLVGDTGEALSVIARRVTEIDALISEIAMSSQEQATGLSQVNSAVNQMDQVTQQNAAMVEEATAAASSLKSEAVQLTQLVGRFDIGNGSDSNILEVADTGRHAPARNPVAGAQARIASAVGRSPVSARQDWKEF